MKPNKKTQYHHNQHHNIHFVSTQYPKTATTQKKNQKKPKIVLPLQEGEMGFWKEEKTPALD